MVWSCIKTNLLHRVWSPKSFAVSVYRWTTQRFMWMCACGSHMHVLKSQRLSSWIWHSNSAYDTFASNSIFVFSRRFITVLQHTHNIRFSFSVLSPNNYADKQYSERRVLKRFVYSFWHKQNIIVKILHPKRILHSIFTNKKSQWHCLILCGFFIR